MLGISTSLGSFAILRFFSSLCYTCLSSVACGKFTIDKDPVILLPLGPLRFSIFDLKALVFELG